jgi:serine/threonine protein kinase/Tfp pilus assembly protein PilF
MAFMNPERWGQINQLFHDALEREPVERLAFLARACDGDESLRSEVESLLASHEQAESFIETPASDVAAELFTKGQGKLEAGQRIGHYKVTGLLGQGGMGEVYLAQDTRLGRPVALKLLPARFTIDVERVRRFEQEARSASALNHPNIVTIHEIGREDSTHFIATEFIDGVTLREHMAGRALKLKEVLDIAAQIASALSAAHEAGIVHRDIKPENVMLRRDGYVKVLDFGLAKLTLHQATMTEAEATTRAIVKTNPGVVMGTVQYMSPEQARGAEVDARTDIWSLGVMLFEMVTGRMPFEGETTSHTAVSILESEPPPLARYAEVPDELERIVNKALRKEREERYQTAHDLALDLKSLKQELEVEARLKRSLQPDENGSGAAKKSDGQAAVVVENLHGPAAQTTHVATPRPTSSAEYVVGEIKRHRRGFALAAAAIAIAVTVAAYYFYFAKSGEFIGSSEVINSVAVLPFVNASGDPNTEYLSDGISDSVINSLSRLPQMRVISLNSVLRYKGKQVDPQAVGRELNIRAVLMGRMTQRGEDLTISAELVDVRDSRRLWGVQYNRKLSDILAVQEEIAREISEGLRLRLSGEEKKLLAKRYTENSEAYLLYSLGNYYFRQNTKEAFEKAIESFEQAIKIDPNYALAYAGLATTYQFMGSRGFAPPKEYEQKVEWAALKALQLDDTLAEAHVSLGLYKMLNFDWAGAEKEVKRALELDPNSSQANAAYAIYLRNVRGADKALPYAIRASELDSSPRPGEPAFAYFLARQYDKAIELYRKNLEKRPDNAHIHILLGEAYVAKGMPAEGVAMMQKGVALDATLDKTPERWDRYPMLAYAYAVAGRRNEALKILDEQHRLTKQRDVSPYNFAIIYTGLGDKDRAFEWLTKCVEQRTLIISHLKSRPLFDPLRSDPRYRELLRRMNLEP